ncbi:HCP-like protein, partial [Linnemannia elongata AG-77]
YARQASHHHSVGSYLMGQMYRKGYGVEMNQGEADRWDLRAAEGGFSVSQHYIGLRYFQVGNYTEALRWYRKAAEQGDREGEFKLGLMHYYGYGVCKNPREAEAWMRKAADREYTPAATGMGIICLEQERYPEAMTWCLRAREDPISEYHIGCLFRYGLGVLPNYVTAMEWFQRSAEKKYSLAEYAIGWMYHNGVSVSKDLEEAKKWYRKAKEHGHLDAANDLGHREAQYAMGVHYHDQGDDTAAESWYSKAAQKGCLKAWSKLGGIFFNKRRYVEALENYTKAESAGDARAQYWLGEIYYQRQDDKLAFEWFYKAAVRGDVDAEYSVGYMYHHGRGVAPSFEEAEKWY